MAGVTPVAVMDDAAYEVDHVPVATWFCGRVPVMPPESPPMFPRTEPPATYGIELDETVMDAGKVPVKRAAGML